MPDIIERIIPHRHTFTPGELDALGQRLAARIQDREQAVAEQKAAMARFKERLDIINDEIHRIAEQRINGFEQRPLLCVLERDEATRQRVWKDQDTEREILREPYQAEDYQYELDLRAAGASVAYRAGVEAWNTGQGEEDNPYAASTTARTDWDRGFNDAMDAAAQGDGAPEGEPEPATT